MKHLHLVLAVLPLLAACTVSQPESKTPQTRIGQLNSCMLNEVYRLKDEGKLAGENVDYTGLAKGILAVCRSRLDIDSSGFNAVQSLEIVTSAMQALH